jgi:hypothetical protein
MKDIPEAAEDVAGGVVFTDVELNSGALQGDR